MKCKGYKVIICFVLFLFMGLQLGSVAYGAETEIRSKNKLEAEIISQCGEEAYEMLLKKFSRDEVVDLYEKGKIKISRMNNLGIHKSNDLYILDRAMVRSSSESSMSFITVIYDDYYDRSDDRTYVSLAIYWSWDKKPQRLGEDAIGIGWGEGMYANSDSTKRNQMEVSYVDTFNNQGAKIVDCDNNMNYIDPTGNIMAKFPMMDTKNGKEIWAKLGNAYIYLSKSGRVPEIAMSGIYGHQTVDIDFSLNIGLNPISMSFDDETIEVVGNSNRYSRITIEKP